MEKNNSGIIKLGEVNGIGVFFDKFNTCNEIYVLTQEVEEENTTCGYLVIPEEFFNDYKTVSLSTFKPQKVKMSEKKITAVVGGYEDFEVYKNFLENI